MLIQMKFLRESFKIQEIKYLDNKSSRKREQRKKKGENNQRKMTRKYAPPTPEKGKDNIPEPKIPVCRLKATIDTSTVIEIRANKGISSGNFKIPG